MHSTASVIARLRGGVRASKKHLDTPPPALACSSSGRRAAAAAARSSCSPCSLRSARGRREGQRGGPGGRGPPALRGPAKPQRHCVWQATAEAAAAAAAAAIASDACWGPWQLRGALDGDLHWVPPAGRAAHCDAPATSLRCRCRLPSRGEGQRRGADAELEPRALGLARGAEVFDAAQACSGQLPQAHAIPLEVHDARGRPRRLHKLLMHGLSVVARDSQACSQGGRG